MNPPHHIKYKIGISLSIHFTVTVVPSLNEAFYVRENGIKIKQDWICGLRPN